MREEFLLVNSEFGTKNLALNEEFLNCNSYTTLMYSLIYKWACIIYWEMCRIIALYVDDKWRGF